MFKPTKTKGKKPDAVSRMSRMNKGSGSKSNSKSMQSKVAIKKRKRTLIAKAASNTFGGR